MKSVNPTTWFGPRVDLPRGDRVLSTLTVRGVGQSESRLFRMAGPQGSQNRPPKHLPGGRPGGPAGVDRRYRCVVHGAGQKYGPIVGLGAKQPSVIGPSGGSRKFCPHGRAVWRLPGKPPGRVPATAPERNGPPTRLRGQHHASGVPRSLYPAATHPHGAITRQDRARWRTQLQATTLLQATDGPKAHGFTGQAPRPARGSQPGQSPWQRAGQRALLGRLREPSHRSRRGDLRLFFERGTGLPSGEDPSNQPVRVDDDRRGTVLRGRHRRDSRAALWPVEPKAPTVGRGAQSHRSSDLSWPGPAGPAPEESSSRTSTTNRHRSAASPSSHPWAFD